MDLGEAASDLPALKYVNSPVCRQAEKAVQGCEDGIDLTFLSCRHPFFQEISIFYRI